MDKFPMMLVKVSPTGEELQGLGRFATTIVSDEAQLTAAREAGWYETPAEAVAPPVKVAEGDDDAPTADELRERLRELGAVTEDGMSVEALAALVADAEAKANAPAPAPEANAPAPAPEAKKPAAKR